MFPATLVQYFNNRFVIHKWENLSGGCINDCYCLYTDKGRYFIKLNSAPAFPRMFEEEARALRLMASTNTVHVPEVIEVGKDERTSYLLLSFIEPGTKQPDTMAQLGRQLALMHQCSAKQFGFENDNYIGSLPQANDWKNTWAEFFVEMRLMPQLKLARDRQLLCVDDADQFERLFKKLPEFFPPEQPALLHGDLWAGNYVVAKNGGAYLIDPSAYYGHREMDLAMASLFGGFANSFFQGYEEVFPLTTGWQKRIDLHNIYPLLVHVNLFGAGYVAQLKGCLQQYL